MSYEVIARKWRPQTFEDVVGQDHVVRTLRNAIEGKRIAQAYLFCGPRGTGKTTLARIFAKALNCEKGPTAHPCGKCDACKAIMDGRSFNVLEIDGASSNKVEDVQEKILSSVNQLPVATEGGYRIYYVDEVHMLSTAAFNALLKTLEEPPDYVKFIFATTEPDKVLGTIQSRCQRFDLRKISQADIVGQLEKICKAEGVDAAPDALLAIARGADGGMRDAESALDQIIAFTGRKISEEDVLGVFGLVSRSLIEDLADAVLSGDIARVLGRLDELDKAGNDLRRLVAELVDHFRNLLVCIELKGDASSLDHRVRRARGRRRAHPARRHAPSRALAADARRDLAHPLRPRVESRRPRNDPQEDRRPRSRRPAAGVCDTGNDGACGCTAGNDDAGVCDAGNEGAGGAGTGERWTAEGGQAGGDGRALGRGPHPAARARPRGRSESRADGLRRRGDPQPPRNQGRPEDLRRPNRRHPMNNAVC